MSGSPSNERLDEIREQFEDACGCPRLAKSDGETMCSSCAADLGWLARDTLGPLLAEVERLRKIEEAARRIDRELAFRDDWPAHVELKVALATGVSAAGEEEG